MTERKKADLGFPYVVRRILRPTKSWIEGKLHQTPGLVAITVTEVEIPKKDQGIVPNRTKTDKEPKRSNEVSIDSWLKSLREIDSLRVASFINYFVAHRREIPGVRLAIIGVGSSVVPEGTEAPDRRPDDIDLRILNSMSEGNAIQDWVITSLRKMVGDFFGDTDRNYTIKREYRYWGESDISILENANEMMISRRLREMPMKLEWAHRTPLHILISGHRQPDMDTHLDNEAGNNNTFVLLHKS